MSQRTLAATLLAAFLLLVGCTAAPPPAPPAPMPQPTPRPAPQPAPRTAPRPAPLATGDPAAAVAAAGAAAGRHDGVDVGVAVAPISGGPVTLGPGGTDRFETASEVKLYTIVDVLHRVETGSDSLDPGDADAIRRALTASDDGAMDQLWEGHGGPRTVTDVVRLVGLQDTAPPRSADYWELTTTSARDVLAVWRYALNSLSPPHRAMVLGATTSSTASGSDGFDQSFGLLADPRPAGVAAKQGWMPDGDHYLHSTGRPSGDSPYLVAVLTRQPASLGWERGREVVDDVVGALVGPLSEAQ